MTTIALAFSFQSSLAGTDEAFRVLAEADRLAWRNNWVKAGPLFARAESLFTEQGDSRNALYARISRLRAEVDCLSYQEVSEYFGQQLTTSMAENDAKLRLRCLVAKASIDILLDPPTVSKPLWEATRELANSIGDQGWASRASGELGIIAFLDGDTASAMKLVGGALTFAKTSGDVGSEIRYISLIGRALTQFGRNDDAIGYFDRAISTAEKNADVGFPHIAYVGKAEALINLGKTAEARKWLDRGLEEAERANLRGYAADVLTTLGRLHVVTREIPQAIDCLERAAQLALQAQLNRLVAPAMLELAKLYRDRGDLQKAEESTAIGVQTARKVAEVYTWPQELAVQAELKARQGEFQEAEALYDRATDVIEGMLVNVPGPTSRSSLVGAMSDIYVKHFNLAMRELKNVTKAFRILEQARGRSEADMLRFHSSESRIAPARRTVADAEIARLQLRLRALERPAERTLLLSRIFEVEQDLARTDDLMPIPAAPVELRQLQNALRPDEMALEFILEEPSSFCLAITRARVVPVSLAGRGRIESLVDRYLAEIRTKKMGPSLAKELYGVLLGEIPGVPQISKLIVMPDGKLHLLPFAGLQDSRGRYTIETYSISYAPSGTVLYLLRHLPRQHSVSLPFLGVGNALYEGASVAQLRSADRESELTRGLYDVRGASFPQLPSTEKEVTTAGQIAGTKSVLLLGRNATEAAFKAQPLSKFEVLHLALHGAVDPTFPDRAALVFTQDSKSGEDGLLQSREISRLHLSAELVTLSACNTGLGKVEGQEGIANLVRAFLYAGARSVVATQWDAEDVSTAALMRQFYFHLAQGKNKGSALREAQLDLLRKHHGQIVPFYWAGFTILGEASRPVVLGNQ